MVVELDGALLDSRDALHDRLQQALELPAYYGRNLDALFDLLTERGEPTELVLRNRAVLEKHLGAYGKALLKTLEQAAAANPKLTLAFAEERER